jgi:hypothetical protein
MRKTGNHRRCPHCRTWFIPSRYNKHSQKYCNGSAECRRESHRVSSRKNYGKVRGDEPFRRSAVFRVQKWRRENPGYWKREKKSSEKINALHDFAQGENFPGYNALRDIVIFQQACVQGLVSFVTGALHDNIGTKMNAFYDKGIALSKEGCATIVKEDFLHETEGDRGSGSAQARV